MTDCSERKEKLYEENLHGDDECNVVCIDKHLLLQEWINNKEEVPLITAHTPSKIFYGVSRGIGDAQNEVNVETSFISQLDCKRKSRKQRTGLHDGEARSLSVIRSLRKRLSEGLADRTSPIEFTLTINSKDDYLDRDWGRGPGEGLATSASLTTLTLTINSKDEYLDRDWGRYLGKSLAKSSSLTVFNLTINSKHRYLGGDWGKGLGEGLAQRNERKRKEFTIPFPSFDLDMGVYFSPLSYIRNRLISHGEEKLGSGSPNFPKCSTKSTEREIKRGIFAPFPDTRNDRMRKEYTMLFGNLRIADSGALDGFFSSFNPDRGVCVSPRSFKRNRPINHGEKTLHSGSQNFSKYSTKLTEQKIKRCIVPPCPYTRNERMQKKCTKKCGDEIFVGKDENIPEVLL